MFYRHLLVFIAQLFSVRWVDRQTHRSLRVSLFILKEAGYQGPFFMFGRLPWYLCFWISSVFSARYLTPEVLLRPPLVKCSSA